MFTVAGLNVAELPFGNPVTVSVTLPVKPPDGVTVIVDDVVVPLGIPLTGRGLACSENVPAFTA